MNAHATPRALPDQPASLLEAAIAKGILDPNASLETIERLLLMQRESEFNTALAVMQPLLPVITENGQIAKPNGEISHTYAEYDDVIDAVQPIMFAHGFSLIFLPGNKDGETAVTGLLSHSCGHSREADFKIGDDPSEDMNDLQAIGSALSYAKRYMAVAMLNIRSRAPWSQDTDGNGRPGLDPVVQTALNAMEVCTTTAMLAEWKVRHEPEVLQLPPKQATPIMAFYRAKARQLKAEG